MSEQTIDKTHPQIQGWLRTALVIISMIGAMYYSKGQIDAHMNNKDVHKSTSELSEIFVLRREYDNNVAGLRDDLRYMRNRIDVLIDRVDKKETSK